MQAKELEATLKSFQKEKGLDMREAATLKAEVARLRSQMDHTGDSQVEALPEILQGPRNTYR